MASEWYYTQDGKDKTGPVSSAQLQALAKSKKLKPTDKVWKEGMAQWVAASRIKGLFSSAGEAVKPNTGNAQPKTRPSPEKGKRPKASDEEQEPPKQGGGRGKVIALGAVAVVALVASLGGAIVVGGWYLTSGTPEKILAENKETPLAGQVDKEKKDAPTDQSKDGETEKKEPPTEQPKDEEPGKTEPPPEQPKDKVDEKKDRPPESKSKKVAKKSDPLLSQLTKVTSAQYKDCGFKKYKFRQSKQELKDIITLRNLVPSLDASLISFRSYGWIPTASSDNAPNEFFYFNQDKLVGFGKLYFKDNKAYMEALLDELGRTPGEHVHALIHRYEDTTQPENEWVMNRTYSYYFFPATVAGICAVQKATVSQKYEWIEFCLFEREWFEDALNEHFASVRQTLEKRKQTAGQLKVVTPPAYLTPYQRELWERSQQGEDIRVSNGDEPIGEAAVPFEIVDPKLRSYLAQAKSSIFVNGQIQFLMKHEGKGSTNRTLAKVKSGTFIYLESGGLGRKTYQKWTGEDWSEPANSLQSLGKYPPPPTVSLESTKYNLSLDNKVRALRGGVFSSFYYAAYARLAQDYFPSRNPTITVFNSIKTSGQSYNPKLYEWDTEDGLGISIGYSGRLSVVRKEKKKL